MTNKIGTTFREGVWYNCNTHSYFFRYLRDGHTLSGGTKYDDGITYSEKIVNGSHDHKEFYITNNSFLYGATEAKPEEIQRFLPYQLTIVDNYQIY